MNISYLSTRTNTNNNRRKQEHSQTNTDTEDRRQGHHNSLEPITVGPWCMHTNKDLQKYKLELHVIRSKNNTLVVEQVNVVRCILSTRISMSWHHLCHKHF